MIITLPLPGVEIKPRIALAPQDRMFPLEDGVELLSVASAARDPDVDYEPQFTFDISFGREPPVQGEPVLAVLVALRHEVKRVMEAFLPFL